MLGRVLPISLAVLALAACGSASSPARLTPANELRVARANVALANFCVDQLRDGTTSTGEIDQELQGIQTLIAVFRVNPKAIYQPGHKGRARTMREVLSDQASAMDNCDPEASKELDRAIRAA